MTVSSTPARASYAGNGATVAFPVPFYFLGVGDLKVVKTDTAGNAVAQSLTTHYSVSGAGNPSGGTLTMVTAPASGETLTIIRDPVAQQSTDYVANDTFPADTHERALDLLTMLAQRLDDKSGRALRLDDGDPVASTALALPSKAMRANKYLRFNASGVPEMADLVASGTTLSQAVIGQLLNLQVTAETTAGVTPTNYAFEVGDVRRYGADPTGTLSSDAAFVAAEAVAFAGGFGKMYAPAGSYTLNNTLTLRSGVTLIGDGSGGSEYYPSSPWNTVNVTRLWRKTSGNTGPVFIVTTASQLRGLFIQYDKVGGSATGAIQVGTATVAALVDGVFNLELADISLYGPAISGVSLADGTCTAIYFYDGSVATSVQRYGNRARGIRIQNFYTGIRLGNNCNANVFSSVVMRQVYQNFVLDGGSEQNCLENVFSGLVLFNIGPLPTVAITFTGAPAAGAVSATLTGAWTQATGTYGVLYSNGEVRQVVLTNGATTATWGFPLELAATTSATAAQSIVFTLRNGAVNNVFSGYTTECNGVAFRIEPTVPITFTANIAAAATSATLASAWTRPSGVYVVTFSDGTRKSVTLTNGATTATWTGGLPLIALSVASVQGCVDNTFAGKDNEGPLSVVPPGNLHQLWTEPSNRSQVQQMLIPAAATPRNYTNGTGNLFRTVQTITGTLPQLNAGAATLVAADVNSKVFARFNTTYYAKAQRPSIRARLTVALNAPGGGVGDAIVSVEFWYRPTDNSTNAGSLSVIRVDQRPSASNYVRGLHFLTGVASALGFGLAIVGGNVGAVTATRFLVDLEVLSMTFSVNAVPMSQLSQITWGTVAATANDVSDAISLLTVADTAV